MNAKELFSAAVKVIGLISILRGCGDIIFVILHAIGDDRVSVTAAPQFPTSDLIFGLFYFFVGLYLLRGAGLLVDYAFADGLEYDARSPADGLGPSGENPNDDLDAR